MADVKVHTYSQTHTAADSWKGTHIIINKADFVEEHTLLLTSSLNGEISIMVIGQPSGAFYIG